MPIIECGCGISYNVKDEYVNQLLRCPECRRELKITRRSNPIDGLFEHDIFFLERDFFSVNEHYQVMNEERQSLLYVDRSQPYVLRILVVALLAAAVYLASSGYSWNKPVAIFGFIWLLSRVFSPRCRVTFFRDPEKRNALFQLKPQQYLQIPAASYVLTNIEQQPLCIFTKKFVPALLRDQWECHSADGTLLCTVVEESVILALLRRIPATVGLRYIQSSYSIYADNKDNVIGEFRSKFRGKFTANALYRLDMSKDSQGLVDRHVAVALGTLLDWG